MIRDASEADLDALVTIYNAAIPGRLATSTAELSVYVAPLAQREGIASHLVSSAIARADGLGLTTLLGFVFAHNERSVSLFREFGFEQWGHPPRVAVLDGVERDLLILGRRLANEPPNAP